MQFAKQNAIELVVSCYAAAGYTFGTDELELFHFFPANLVFFLSRRRHVNSSRNCRMQRCFRYLTMTIRIFINLLFKNMF